MNHTTTCRFCHKPITLEIDDDYAALGDPLNVLKLAACDHCAVLRVNRKRLEEKIQRACSYLEFLGTSDAKQRSILRNILLSLSRKYGQLIVSWHNETGNFDSPVIAAKLADDPSNWKEHLSEYWSIFPQWRDNKPQSTLPYKDE